MRQAASEFFAAISTETPRESLIYMHCTLYHGGSDIALAISYDPADARSIELTISLQSLVI